MPASVERCHQKKFHLTFSETSGPCLSLATSTYTKCLSSTLLQYPLHVENCTVSAPVAKLCPIRSIASLPTSTYLRKAPPRLVRSNISVNHAFFWWRSNSLWWSISLKIPGKFLRSHLGNGRSFLTGRLRISDSYSLSFRCVCRC